MLIGNFLAYKGVTSPTEEIARHLKASGWKVVYASSKTARLARLVDMIKTTWGHRHDYKSAHVDVYSGAAFLWAEIVCRLLRVLGKPFTLTLHGGNLPAFSRRWPGRVHNLLQSAVVVTAPSGYLLDQMRPYRQDLLLIPNGLHIQAYRFRGRTRVSPKLIWLRSFHAMYNPQLAPKVLNLLATEFPDIHLTMVGPDKGDSSLEKTMRKAQEMGVADRISFQGQVPKADVPYWMDRGDIFLNTTYIDNMPVSVIEAMASGLCLVSTDVGGIPYLLEHEKDALLVPPDDPSAMAAAVRRILTEPDLAARLSENARQKAEQFDWSVILPQWEALVSAVAQGHPA